jgi:hypothetical protein
MCMRLRPKYRSGKEMPFATVIPTGAPRGLVVARNPRARSGGIPTEYPSPYSFREFSPTCQAQWPAAERIYRGARLPTFFVQALGYHRRTWVLGRIHGKNSPWQHGQGESLGISPLRAEGFCQVPKASRRSGRDDRVRHFSAARARFEEWPLSSLETYEIAI